MRDAPSRRPRLISSSRMPWSGSVPPNHSRTPATARRRPPSRAARSVTAFSPATPTPTPPHRIREQERVADDDEARGLGHGASAVAVAVLCRAVNPYTVERVRRDLRPQHFLSAVETELGAVPALCRVQPDQNLELEFQLVGVRARLGKEAPPTP